MDNPLRRLFDPGDWLAAKPRLDPDAILLVHERKPDPAEYKLRIYVGLFVMCVVAVIVYLVDDSFGRFVAGGFGVFGLLNFIYGVMQSGFEISLAITPDEVRLSTKTLFGRGNWREPLSAYRGVLLRESQVAGQSVGNIDRAKQYQIIELSHNDRRKTVALYVEESSTPPWAVQQAFAKRLRLPVLFPGEGGDRGGDPGPPPSGVAVEQDGAVTRITVGPGRWGRRLGLLVYLGVALMFSFVGYQIEPVAGLVAGGMAFLLFAILLILGRLLGRAARPPAICITDERVWIDRPRLKTPALIGTFRAAMQQAIGVESHALLPEVESLPIKAVERIRVDDYVQLRESSGPRTYPRLLIEAAAGRLELTASQFDRGKLEWVRGYLQSRLQAE